MWWPPVMRKRLLRIWNNFKRGTVEYFCYLLFAGKAEHGAGLQRWKKGGIYEGALRVTLKREVWDRIELSRSWVLQRSGRGGVLINFRGTIHWFDEFSFRRFARIDHDQWPPHLITLLRSGVKKNIASKIKVCIVYYMKISRQDIRSWMVHSTATLDYQ